MKTFNLNCISLNKFCLKVSNINKIVNIGKLWSQMQYIKVISELILGVSVWGKVFQIIFCLKVNLFPALKLMDPVPVTSNALNTWWAYRVTSENNFLVSPCRDLYLRSEATIRRVLCKTFCKEIKECKIYDSDILQKKYNIWFSTYCRRERISHKFPWKCPRSQSRWGIPSRTWD